MNQLKRAVTDGFIVLATLAILFFVFRWLLGVLKDIIEPLTTILLRYVTVPEYVAFIGVIAIIFVTSFFVGNFVRTWLGEHIHKKVEKIIPLYKTIKAVLTSILGEGKFLACPVVVAQLFSEVSALGLITATHSDGRYSIFVPTAPNPTTGFLFILPKERVQIIPGATKEMLFQAVIACGLGSEDLLRRLKDSQNS
ncbi:MAG: DUF502 domain-containing protein [Parcubacteria group bacterium]|nr:DUF502 domain-containing protein [Parcubacteria group bacterium]